MDQAPDTGALVASILNAAWWVRYYGSQRTKAYRCKRAAALVRLGLAVRQAFSQSEDFEPLLGAVIDGLRPRDERPF